MGFLDLSLQEAVSSIPECVAAGYVDMSAGILLVVKTVDSHSQEVLDLVAAATADLFQGPTVVGIERLFRKSRGQKETGEHYFHEILVFSENLLHVFMRCKGYTDHAVVFVTRKSANVGMVLAKSRMSLSSIEASV